MSAKNLASRTWGYTAFHTALQCTARTFDTTPFTVRVLVAVEDRNDRAIGQDIEGDLQSEGSAVRRASSECYRNGWLMGESLVGGPVKRGTPAVFNLTAEGRKVVDEFHAHHKALTTPLKAVAA